MITEIKIKNFKSVADLTLPLGRFNVMIGSNGSGKSNILEAIAFGGAAAADKLDSEFLGSRGIRATSAQLMKSAFFESSLSNPIVLKFKNDDRDIELDIDEEAAPILKWSIKAKQEASRLFQQLIFSIINEDFRKEFYESRFYTQLDAGEKKKIETISTLLKNIQTQQRLDNPTKEDVNMTVAENLSIFTGNPIIDRMYKKTYDSYLAQFIIYSPEISYLRKLDEESQIKPLGIKGEGLFSVLQIFQENYGLDTIREIVKYLHLIEWFDDFKVVRDEVTGSKGLVIKDRNLPDVTLNQNEVNEGFLFLLFYISLMISNETPAFFAIDNIEASFHPRLCEEIIKNLVILSKAHNKQVIFTTHNPFVLDGLNLNDPEQKLFVVRRNGDGETIADNIEHQPKNTKLSEAWMRGLIGGQPETIE